MEEQFGRLSDFNTRAAVSGVNPHILAAWDTYGLPVHFEGVSGTKDERSLKPSLLLLAAGYSSCAFDVLMSYVSEKDLIALRACTRTICASVDEHLIRHLVVYSDGEILGPGQHYLPRADSSATSVRRFVPLPRHRQDHHVAPETSSGIHATAPPGRVRWRHELVRGHALSGDGSSPRGR